MKTLLQTSGDRDLAPAGVKGTLQRPPFEEALRFWCKLGWISFGKGGKRDSLICPIFSSESVSI